MAIQKFAYALLVAMVIAGPALAQPGPADRVDRRLKALDAKLDLTDEQEARIRQILTTHEEDVQTWTSENDNAAREDRREHFRVRADDLREDIRAILTPEQASRFAAFQPARGDRSRSGAGMRRGQDGRRGKQGMGRKPNDRRGGADLSMGRLVEQLELSDAQRMQVKDILEQHREEGSAWRNAHPDATREQKRSHHEDHFEQLKSELSQVLAQDQLLRFEELYEARRSRMPKSKGRK